MKFFVSAIDEDSADILAQEIEADDFEQALGMTYALARQRFEGRPGRVTSVTEVPELLPALERLERIYAGVRVAKRMLPRRNDT